MSTVTKKTNGARARKALRPKIVRKSRKGSKRGMGILKPMKRSEKGMKVGMKLKARKSGVLKKKSRKGKLVKRSKKARKSKITKPAPAAKGKKALRKRSQRILLRVALKVGIKHKARKSNVLKNKSRKGKIVKKSKNARKSKIPRRHRLILN